MEWFNYLTKSAINNNNTFAIIIIHSTYIGQRLILILNKYTIEMFS